MGAGSEWRGVGLHTAGLSHNTWDCELLGGSLHSPSAFSCFSISCFIFCSSGIGSFTPHFCVSVIEALKKNHKEELDKEVEKVRRLSSGGIDAQTLQVQQK